MGPSIWRCYSLRVSERGAEAVVEQTEVGSYFVANYPPFSVWTREAVEAEARRALATPPVTDVPLGLYLHIPFCRKRCHFCYFRVYTDKNAREVAGLPGRARARVGALLAAGGHRRPAPELRLLRRRHAFVPLDRPARAPRPRPERGRALDRGRGDHVRVRAGHPHRGQADRDPRLRRDPPEPRHRELRRRHPRAQRACPSLGGDLPLLVRRPRPGLPADQHRPHRGHGGRDRRELACLHPRRRWRWSRTA